MGVIATALHARLPCGHVHAGDIIITRPFGVARVHRFVNMPNLTCHVQIDRFVRVTSDSNDTWRSTDTGMSAIIVDDVVCPAMYRLTPPCIRSSCRPWSYSHWSACDKQQCMYTLHKQAYAYTHCRHSHRRHHQAQISAPLDHRPPRCSIGCHGHVLGAALARAGSSSTMSCARMRSRGLRQTLRSRGPVQS